VAEMTKLALTAGCRAVHHALHWLIYFAPL